MKKLMGQVSRLEAAVVKSSQLKSGAVNCGITIVEVYRVWSGVVIGARYNI
jgi:hypothetical protein